MLAMDLNVKNVDLILREINAFDKDAQKTLRTEIREATNVITETSRGLIPSYDPLSGWGRWIEKKSGRDLSWDSARVKSGIKSSVSLKRIGGLYGVMGITRNATPVGAIFVIAGSRTRQGRFTPELNRRFGSGPWPRALGRAWTMHVDTVRARIADAIVKAAAAVGR